MDRRRRIEHDLRKEIPWQPIELRTGVGEMKRVWGFLVLAAIAAEVLCACGGGSSASTDTAPAKVTGVATPKSVSVVTAN
jgi:hypothetical protein